MFVILVYINHLKKHNTAMTVLFRIQSKLVIVRWRKDKHKCSFWLQFHSTMIYRMISLSCILEAKIERDDAVVW